MISFTSTIVSPVNGSVMRSSVVQSVALKRDAPAIRSSRRIYCSGILLTTSIVDRQDLLAAIKLRLQHAHRRRLRAVVLYGSEARGEARPDSDLDVLVLLDGPIDYGTDLRTNINALYDSIVGLRNRLIHGYDD